MASKGAIASKTKKTSVTTTGSTKPVAKKVANTKPNAPVKSEAKTTASTKSLKKKVVGKAKDKKVEIPKVTDKQQKATKSVKTPTSKVDTKVKSTKSQPPKTVNTKTGKKGVSVKPPAKKIVLIKKAVEKSVVGKAKVTKASSLKNSIDECFKELQTHPTIGKQMKKKLEVVKAAEVDAHGAKSMVIYIKAYILKAIRRFLPTLKSEMEKKTGKNVFFIGYRRIMPKPAKRSAAAKHRRPYRRTASGVHESMLIDLAFPSEIMGKRIVYRPNGCKITKIYLDKKLKDSLEPKLRVLTDVYKRLTGRDAKFEFPLYDCPMRAIVNSNKKA